MARLLVVGLSHKSAPIEVREQAAFPEDALKPALERALQIPGVGEAMIVSTCNRVELYSAADGDAVLEELTRFMVDGRGLHASLRAYLYAHDGEPAVRHLFRVAASLDSMVVGESQILGQVKEAYQVALEMGTIGPLLTRTLPRAFAAAKRVRTETEVAKSSSSVASAAVDLATQIFGDLSGRDVLVVGAGKMGDLSARHLKASGIGRLHVVNRTLSRAEELAQRLGGTAAPWVELDALLARVDIVLCSTGAQEPVIRRERVEKVMRARRGRWLFFIDIAVPRDVDPQVGEIENVYLYDVDGLQKVVGANLAERAREAKDAHAILEEEIARFFRTELSLGVVPTIKLLRERFLGVAQGEAERVLGKMQNATDKDRQLVKQLAEAIVNKLLHHPMTHLKRAAAENPDAELAETVRSLFDLRPDEPAAPELEQAPARAGKDK